MNARKRLLGALSGGEVDRVPFVMLFGPWATTIERWRNEGLENPERWAEEFCFDPLWVGVPVNLGWCPPWPQREILRDLGDRPGLAAVLGNRAGLLAAMGDVDAALELMRESEGIRRDLGETEGLAIALANRAALTEEHLGRPREALALADEAHRIAADHGLVRLAGQIESFRAFLRRRIG